MALLADLSKMAKETESVKIRREKNNGKKLNGFILCELTSKVFLLFLLQISMPKRNVTCYIQNIA